MLRVRTVTSFNLIPKRRLEAKSRRARMRAWIIACTAYAVVILGAYALTQSASGGPDSALAAHLAKAAAETKKWDRQVRMLRGKVGKARLTLEANRAVGEQPDWAVVLALLAKNLDDDLVLKRCKLHPEPVEKPKSKSKKRTKGEPAPKPKRFILDISGFGRSQKAISQFVLRLEGSKLFEKVTAVKTNREPFMAGKAMAFQIRCLLGRKQEAQ